MNRVLAILCLSVLLASATGCFVLDELEEGDRLMDQHLNHGKARKAAEAKKAADALANTDEGRAAAKKRAAKYWDKARTLSPGTVSEDIVGCRLKGSTQFMKEDACRARGGVPSGG